MAKICQMLHLQLKQTPHDEKMKNKLFKQNCCFTHSKTSLNSDLTLICGLYYKCFMIVIYDRNNSGQYYKTTILARASLS
jgi:hypothetical protein